MNKKTENIYIATLPRSGSTLLGMILGAHSQVFHIGESAYWSKLDVSTTKCCCGEIGCQTLVEISMNLSQFRAEVSSIYTAYSAIDMLEEPDKIRHKLSFSDHVDVKNKSPEFDSLIDRCSSGLDIVANVVRRTSGKSVIVENSKHPLVAERLLEKKDNWKVIILTRDPRGIAFCNKKAGKRKNVPRPIESKLNVFLSFAQRAFLLSRKRNTLLVRYEDLCKDTFRVLRTMCQFIGIDFEKRMLMFKDNKGHMLMGNHMMYDKNQEIKEDIDWRCSLDSREKELFLSRDLVLAYKRLGYDLTDGM